jgi:vitamin B12 transporter
MTHENVYCLPHRRKLSWLKQLILLVILLFLMLPLLAQNYVLRIEDSQGSPLAHVKVRGSKTTVISDENGNVSISLSGETLHFSRLGYEDLSISSKEIPQTMIIVMQAKAIEHPMIRVHEREPRGATPALDIHLIHPDTNSRALGSADLLLNSVSFASSDNRLIGERQTLSLLGSLNRHTLVMLDGVALNTAGEAFDFSKIPVSQIERIEIIKGNASAYGGSAAIGGIVNIITKAPKRLDQAELGISTRIGSYDMFGQEYQISLMKRALSLFAQYRHYYALNDFSYQAWWDPDTQYRREHNAKTSDNLYLKSSIALDQHRLEYTLSQGAFIRQLPGPINFTELYDDSRMSGSNWFHSGKYIWQSRNLMGELRAFYQSDYSAFRNLEPSNPQNPNKYSQDQSTSGLQSNLSLILAESNLDLLAEIKRIEFGFTEYDLNGGSKTMLKGDRENYALALRGGHKYPLAVLDGKTQLSLRADAGDNEEHFTWRAEQELSYQAGARYYLGGNLGTAFALPSLYDMYWIGDSETLGNPDLESEKSRAFSLRAGIEHKTWQLKAAYYDNEIDNLIQWRQIFLFGSRWKPFNVGTAKIRNLELEGKWQALSLLSFFGGITFTEAKDFSKKADGSNSATYGKYLTYTPDLKASLTMKLADDKRSIGLSWNYTGEQYSTVDNAIDPLPGFDVLDLSLMHKFTLAKLEISLEAGIKNILNKAYEIYAYTPQPGINWNCGMSLNYVLF